MLLLSNSLNNRKILSLRVGGPIGIALSPIMNPHNLTIIGWYCNDKIHKQHVILLAQDIRQVLPDGFVVNDQEVLCEIAEIVREKNIVEMQYSLIGQPVYSGRKRLGRISDYATDPNVLAVKNIYVSQSLRKIRGGELIIGRDQIIEIKADRVIVKGAEVRRKFRFKMPYFGIKPQEVAEPLNSASNSTTSE